MGLLLGSAQGATTTVDAGQSLQEAIEDASPGDVLEVKSGVYRENLNITKQLILLGVDTGGGMPVVDAGGAGDSIILYADGIILQGFVATNSGHNLEAGIKIISDNNVVMNNEVRLNNGTGIFVSISSKNNSIINNNVSYNNKSGIFLWSSNESVISENIVSGNRWIGIRLMDSSSGNIIDNNVVHHNEMHGISIESSVNNSIIENDAGYNELDGILIDGSPSNSLEGNDASYNAENGFRIQNSSHSLTLQDNYAKENRYGISVQGSNDIYLKDNKAIGNGYGIYLSGSVRSIMDSNLMVENRYNFRADGENYIDTTNLVDGRPIYYRVGVSDEVIDDSSGAGAVYCINCDNVTIKGLNLTNGFFGVYLSNTINSAVEDNRISLSWNGIYVENSSSNRLTANSVIENENGIFLNSSSENAVDGNIVVSNSYGIVLESSYENRVDSNNASLNFVGIDLYKSSDYNIVQENVATKNGVGIHLNSSGKNSILGNDVSNSEYICIYLVDNSISNNIKKNNASNAWFGIYLTENSIENIILYNDANDDLIGIFIRDSPRNLLEGNRAKTNEFEGIRIQNSAGCSLSGNNASQGQWGIYINSSGMCVLRDNLMENNLYNFHAEGEIDVDRSNSVDGKPIIYLMRAEDLVIDSSDGAGVVYCIDCTNITVKDLILANNTYGIYLLNTTGSRVEMNRIFDNEFGILLNHCGENEIIGNEVDRSGASGIRLHRSERNLVSENEACQNGRGIDLFESVNNTISRNLVYDNGKGIYLDGSSQNLILSNDAVQNDFGLFLEGSDHNKLTSNDLRENEGGLSLNRSGKNVLGNNLIIDNGYNFLVDGLNRSHFDNQIDVTNLINGRPIRYLVDSSNTIVDSSSGASSVVCINCTNVTVKDLDLRGNREGIKFFETRDSTIKNNILSDNLYGISLERSTKNSVEANYLRNNTYGIFLNDSFDNLLEGNRAGEMNTYGIYLAFCRHNILRDNLMAGNRYNFYARGDNDIDLSNRVDGKPIFYLVNVSSAVISASSDAGVVYCLDCEDVMAEGLILQGNVYGICFENTTRSRADNNSIIKNIDGIFLDNSDGNVIIGNHISENNGSGLLILRSSANTITKNTAKDNFGDGIRLSASSNNIISENVASANDKTGIILERSPLNVVAANSAQENECGISLNFSGGNRLKENQFAENVRDFSAEGSQVKDLDNDVDLSNIVGGERIIYMVGASDRIVNSTSDAGTVYCIDCFNITLEGLKIENNSNGIYLFHTAESAIRNCTISKNLVGIKLVTSSRNEIAANSVKENGLGVLISNSEYNKISRNEFLKNRADGIMLIDSDRNQIFNNDASLNGESGILLDPSNKNDVIGNRLAENGAYRIKFDAGSNDNHLRGNGPDISPVGAAEEADIPVAPSSPSSGSSSGGGGHVFFPPRVEVAEPSLPDYAALVEEAKRSLTRGMIAFDPVREMLVGETYRVEARISISETVENLTAGFEEGEVPLVEGIPVSTFMKVRLSGTAFEITPMTDELQLITRDGHRTWLWDVIPRRSGVHELTLSAFAEVVLPGQEPMPVDAQVFSSPITVTARKVPLKEKARNFLAADWKFIVGTLILGSGLSKWLIGRIRARSQKREAKPPGGGEEGVAKGADFGEIDFAALEEAVIGRRDRDRSGEGRTDAGKMEEIDFAALEEAVIGRKDPDAGGMKGDRLGDDRIGEGRLEEARSRMESPRKAAGPKVAEGEKARVSDRAGGGPRPERRRKMRWTVIKADKTGKVRGAKGGDGVIAGEIPSKPPEDRRATEGGSDRTGRILERGGEGRGEEGERQAPLGVKTDKKARRRGRRKRTGELKEERRGRRRPER